MGGTVFERGCGGEDGGESGDGGKMEDTTGEYGRFVDGGDAEGGGKRERRVGEDMLRRRGKDVLRRGRSGREGEEEREEEMELHGSGE